MLKGFMSMEQTLQAARAEIGKVISGQQSVIEQVLAAALSDGHVLLEGVPGLGKTLLVRTLGRVFGMEFGRVQFTPDLMPADVTGTMVFDAKTSEFVFRPGPMFVGLLLADEINRTTPKTQSALLEAMEERQITLDGITHTLPRPFLVFATQNPIEYEGTYPLPEAQQDRFLMKVVLSYPAPEEELQVLYNHHRGFRPAKLEEAGVQQVVSVDQLLELQEQTRQTTVEEKIFGYIHQIVRQTRDNRDVLVGASTRAGLAMLSVGKAMARLRGRDFVIPDDVKDMATAVLRHRVQLRPEAEVEGQSSDDVVRRIIESVPVPR